MSLGNLVAMQAGNAVAVVSMGQDLSVEMERRRRKSGGSCHMKRLRKVGTRCFCGGKMAKTSRCR